MERYYEIHCSTPYVGEDNYYYYRTNNIDKLKHYATDCMYENGAEWYDIETMEDYPDEDDYFEACDFHIKEITKEEYEEECPWDVR